ncbi:MAG: LbtU family siderophore porin [Gammaproteobacteria bacterium]|nr:LbtU family siderophore porin [Gammaproteobacteria bacterium]
MKLSHIAASVAVSLACVGAAFAATQAQTTATVTTKKVRHHHHHHVQMTQSEVIAQQGAQIRQLQAEMAQIKGGSVGVSPNASIARSSDAATSGFMTIKTDGKSPFELLPSNSFTTALLEGKQAYTGTPQSLVLGGYLEADAQAWNGGNTLPTAANQYKNGSNAYITTADLDAMANVTDWITGFIELKDSYTAPSDNVNMSKAFIMLGNLNQSPFFAVAGKTNVAFGAFGGGGPWSNALQRSAFRPNETNQIRGGYDHNGLVSEVSVISNNGYNNNLQDLAYTISYTKQINLYNYSVGASYLSDMRGTSSAVGSAYNNTMTNSSTQTIFGKKNGLYDVNGQVGYGNYAVIGEFLRSTTGATVIATNKNTGLMSAWVLGGSYSPIIMSKATAFTLSYSKTNHMASVPMYLAGNSVPSVITAYGFKNAWIASASREVANNFYVGPDFQLDQSYNNAHTWTATVDLSLYF